MAFKKYSARFAKVHCLQYSVHMQSEVIKRKRQTLHRVLNTFVSKTVANFSTWFVFYARLNYGFRKNIAPFPSFVYYSRKNENQKRRHGF